MEKDNNTEIHNIHMMNLTLGIKRLIDGMELNSIAFLHARIAAFVADCRVIIDTVLSLSVCM